MSGKVRIQTLRDKKARGEKVIMLTAYDYPVARLLDEAGVDIVLVGDSLGMVVLGYETTLAVSMRDMMHHCKAVARGVSQALLVVDMPFMSYKLNSEQALRNASLFLHKASMEAVKLEGGEEIAPTVQRLVEAGIPVMGHIGLTPQSIHLLSGYRVQGKNNAAVKKLVADAQALEQAGAFALVLEAVPEKVGKMITEAVTIVTIGIGAGRYCNGQVLVTHDLLGLSFFRPPRFVKHYANLRQTIQEAVERFIKEVKEEHYPDKEHVYENE